MGIKIYGGPETEYPSLIPTGAIFAVSGPGGSGATTTVSDRPRRVHVTLTNQNGQTIAGRRYVPFYLSNSSLGRSTTRTSALTSGTTSGATDGENRPFSITSNGSLEVTGPGIAGVLGTNSAGNARLNVSNASSVTVGRRHLVLLMPGGGRAISPRIRILSS